MNERLDKYVLEAGVLDIRKLQKDGLYPSDERLSKGPIAVFECAQEIPCNPCEGACKRGFVEIGEDITTIPVVREQCTGCGLCLPSCPGLSIFVLNAAYSDHEASITLPYELLPLPEEGEPVIALDRRGRPAGEARVLQVRKLSPQDPCHSVTIALAKNLLHEVRYFARKTHEPR